MTTGCSSCEWGGDLCGVFANPACEVFHPALNHRPDLQMGFYGRCFKSADGYQPSWPFWSDDAGARR
jgi:hypothetical protein